MSNGAADSASVPPVDTRYKESALPVEQRVEILLQQMTLEEKAGLFFQTMIALGPGGELSEGEAAFGIASSREYVVERHLTHFNLLGAAPTAREIARWHNKLQELAASTRLGIPVTISTDPRHSFSENPGAAIFAGPFSQWPEPLGLAATQDAELVERFGDIARQEYTAVGIRAALHPQVDLATEPRWARQLQTFGEDPDLSGRLGAAYIRGFQHGSAFGSGAVSTMVKHFPGGGPQKDGEDPHFAYGREQVYPGGKFELHLKPFEAAFEVGVRQVMPYYGMPVRSSCSGSSTTPMSTRMPRTASSAMPSSVRRVSQPSRRRSRCSPTASSAPRQRPRCRSQRDCGSMSRASILPWQAGTVRSSRVRTMPTSRSSGCRLPSSRAPRRSRTSSTPARLTSPTRRLPAS